MTPRYLLFKLLFAHGFEAECRQLSIKTHHIIFRHGDFLEFVPSNVLPPAFFICHKLVGPALAGNSDYLHGSVFSQWLNTRCTFLKYAEVAMNHEERKLFIKPQGGSSAIPPATHNKKSEVP